MSNRYEELTGITLQNTDYQAKKRHKTFIIFENLTTSLNRQLKQKKPYIGSIDQLNNLGVARQEKILYASSEVQPKVKLFLICGGILMVRLSMFLSCPSRNVQLVITSLIAALISFSIYLVLSLQNPFAVEISVKPKAFTEIHNDFKERLSLGDYCQTNRR
jgi:hypothetical protein